MKYTLAPMEGITGYVYRNAYANSFTAMDAYVTPFVSPNQNRLFSPKELREVEIEHNKNLHVIVQILTNQAKLFVETAKALEQMGYDEVNVNLGCPSATVVTKRKGAGQLKDLDLLDCFLEEIYQTCPLKVSIKTRIGVMEPTEFEDLFAIYEKYPISCLTIHPRTREEFYQAETHDDWFSYAMEERRKKGLSMEIAYNGNIYTPMDAIRKKQKWEDLDGIMLGRGIITNPFLLEQIKAVEDGCTDLEQIHQMFDRERLQQFLKDVLDGYLEILKDDVTTLFRLKELWSYLANSFEGIEKPLKALRKSVKISEYEKCAKEIVRYGKVK